MNYFDVAYLWENATLWEWLAYVKGLKWAGWGEDPSHPLDFGGK